MSGDAPGSAQQGRIILATVQVGPPLRNTVCYFFQVVSPQSQFTVFTHIFDYTLDKTAHSSSESGSLVALAQQVLSYYLSCPH